MNPLILAPLLEVGKSMLDRWFPDPAEKAKAEADMLRLLQEDDLKKVLAQLEVNAKEAASPHMFVAGWRPAVGWCCAAGFLWSTIGHPVFTWFAIRNGWPPPPAVDTEVLMYVLGGLLGLGSFRMVEKIKGVAK